MDQGQPSNLHTPPSQFLTKAIHLAVHPPVNQKGPQCQYLPVTLQRAWRRHGRLEVLFIKDKRQLFCERYDQIFCFFDNVGFNNKIR